MIKYTKDKPKATMSDVFIESKELKKSSYPVNLAIYERVAFITSFVG